MLQVDRLKARWPQRINGLRQRDNNLRPHPVGLECRHLLLPTHPGLCTRGLMLTHIGNVPSPFQDFDIGRFHIQDQAGLLELGHQGNMKTIAQVADKAFYLTCGPGPIRPAQARRKACLFGQLPHARMKPVQPVALGITLLNDRLHIVIQHLSGHTLEVAEGVFMTALARGKTFIADKFHIAIPAPAQGRHKRR